MTAKSFRNIGFMIANFLYLTVGFVFQLHFLSMAINISDAANEDVGSRYQRADAFSLGIFFYRLIN